MMSFGSFLHVILVAEGAQLAGDTTHKSILKNLPITWNVDGHSCKALPIIWLITLPIFPNGPKITGDSQSYPY